MDEVRVRLSSKLVKRFIARIIANTLYKKIGVKIDIYLNALSVEVIDGRVNLHVDANGEIDRDEFVRLTKSVGLD